MNLYWIRSYNFGDILNPILYQCITGKEAEFSESSPKFLAIGSILDRLGPGDTVWGTGAISSYSTFPYYRTSTIRAVRGPLTDSVLEMRGYAPCGVYGDPALLLPRFIKPSVQKSGKIAFMPHYIDMDGPFDLPSDVMLLSPATPPLELIEQITSCVGMVSSSLHGLCVAEAYGIPAAWAELSDNVAGAGFKFRDYYLGTGRPEPVPMGWRTGQNWDHAHIGLDRWVPPVISEELLNVCPF